MWAQSKTLHPRGPPSPLAIQCPNAGFISCMSDFVLPVPWTSTILSTATVWSVYSLYSLLLTRGDESHHDTHCLNKYLWVLKPTFSILSVNARSFCLSLWFASAALPALVRRCAANMIGAGDCKDFSRQQVKLHVFFQLRKTSHHV